jgi:hypothetical protein
MEGMVLMVQGVLRAGAQETKQLEPLNIRMRAVRAANAAVLSPRMPKFCARISRARTPRSNGQVARVLLSRLPRSDQGMGVP